jgi:hypothetical protein
MFYDSIQKVIKPGNYWPKKVDGGRLHWQKKNVHNHLCDQGFFLSKDVVDHTQGQGIQRPKTKRVVQTL